MDCVRDQRGLSHGWDRVKNCHCEKTRVKLHEELSKRVAREERGAKRMNICVRKWRKCVETEESREDHVRRSEDKWEKRMKCGGDRVKTV